jgi:cell division septum initiation protein DivIVA
LRDRPQVARSRKRLSRSPVLETILNEHQEHERRLKRTLLAAQRLADDINATAEQEAGRITTRCEDPVGLLLERIQARLEGIQREIDRLKASCPSLETLAPSRLRQFGR